MKQRLFPHSRKISMICGLLLLLDAPRLLMGEEPTPAQVSAFNSYSKAVETRLAEQHRSSNGILALPVGDLSNLDARLRQGELLVERVNEKTLTQSIDAEPAGALLHHWRGTAFALGAKAADFERLMRDFHSYPQHFSPEVIQAGIIAQTGDRMQAWLRVRQHHVITVVMDSTYNVTFGRLDTLHGYSISRSTQISEIDSPGTGSEHALTAREEHGFLWRLNTYWSYEERDGGLYLQVESVSLTRSVPTGLGWAIRPYLESIPRESLEFTLRSACHAITK